VVQAVGSPYVAPGTARLRVIVTAAHSPADVVTVLEAFADVTGLTRNPTH
jgi:7-keto-8-aminopelargonate synthetase-like enzyme